MSLYNDASLVMIPSAYKDGKLYSIRPTDGSGDFTFSRGSNLAATRVDENGLIEKGRENLLLQSNQFDTTWGNSNSTETGGQADKDGGTDAWRIDKTASGGYLVQNIGTSGVQTFSVYAKAGTTDWMQLLTLGSGTGSRYVFYDLTNGVIGSQSGSGTYGIDSNIESVGGGWYRCSLTFNTTLNDVRVYPAEANSVSAASGNIYIQDAQLELGLVATDYIETTTTTAQAGILEDMPRLDYNGGASCPSLLLEPQRSNLISYSEYFGGWNGFRTDLSANSATSPEGVSNAYSMVPNTDNNTHFIYFNTSESAVDYSFSLFAKSNGQQWIQLAKGGGGYANFDLINGVKGNFGTDGSSAFTDSDIEDFGNGWYRITAYYTSVGGASNIAISALSSNVTSRYQSFAGNGTDGYYIYGAQLESNASYPSSYIPTYGSAVTRSQDVCKISGANAIIDNPSMTLFAEMNYDTANTNTTILSIIRKSSGGLYGDFISLIMRNDSEFQIEVRSNNTAQATIRSSSISSGNHKIAAVLSNNNVKLFIDGVLVGSDTSVTLPTGLNEIYLNGYPDSSARYGTKKQYLYFLTALTDSECIALTTL